MPSGERGREHHGCGLDLADTKIAELCGFVAVHEELPPVGGGPALPPDLDRPPLHRRRTVDPEEVEDRRRDVDELDEARASRRRRPQQARVDARRAEPEHREGDGARRVRGTDDEHGVALEIDLLEQAPEQPVGAVDRLPGHHLLAHG